jgi:hypothetical protein
LALFKGGSQWSQSRARLSHQSHPSIRRRECFMTKSPTESPSACPALQAVRKWIPPNTRASTTSSSAAEKPGKLRDCPGNASLVIVMAVFSPKYWERTRAAAPLAQEWAEGYSGNGGVTISGVHSGSGSVSGFTLRSANAIAVIGRHDTYVYFASQQPIMESDMARFTCASGRAVCNRLNRCFCASESGCIPRGGPSV